MSREHCRYCQTETPCGEIADVVGEKDLLKYTSTLMGDEYTIYVAIDDGDLIMVNHDFNPFAEVQINYCPMCGRKLKYWKEAE